MLLGLLVFVGLVMVGHVHGMKGKSVQASSVESRLLEKIRSGAIAGLEPVDQKELKKIAETDGYGYKTTNLMMLQKLSEKLSKRGAAREHHPAVFLNLRYIVGCRTKSLCLHFVVIATHSKS